jgi:hypothetical protein
MLNLDPFYEIYPIHFKPGVLCGVASIHQDNDFHCAGNVQRINNTAHRSAGVQGQVKTSPACGAILPQIGVGIDMYLHWISGFLLRRLSGSGFNVPGCRP